jgi:sorting and assembly machinery component 37
LDLDAVEEERKQQRSRDDGTAAGKIPASLVWPPRETVSSLLGRTSLQKRIRLDGMVDAFVAPLEELLGGKDYLLSDEIPSSLDCLALGYLSLALVPDLAYPWLSQAVETYSPRLVGCVNRLRERCFGGAVDVKTALSNAVEGEPGLPWRAPERISMGRMLQQVLEGLASATPVVREIRASQRLQQAGKGMETGMTRAPAEVQARGKRWEAYVLATVVAGLGVFVGYLVQEGVVRFAQQQDTTEPTGAEKEAGDARPASAYGEAGTMLGI